MAKAAAFWFVCRRNLRQNKCRVPLDFMPLVPYYNSMSKEFPIGAKVIVTMVAEPKDQKGEVLEEYRGRVLAGTIMGGQGDEDGSFWIDVLSDGELHGTFGEEQCSLQITWPEESV